MASPQLENGFTRISNELLEALMTVKMSGSEWQYMMCLFRKTYGYNQKEAWVKNAYVCLSTGLCKERVSETKKKLLARKIVTEKRNFISLNKNYEEWIELRKNVTIVTEKRNNLLRKSVPIKERKKTIKEKGENTFSSLNLKNKQIANMGWNNRGDDFEEGVVNYETGELEEEKKPQTKKYPNAIVVIKLFQEILGLNQSFWKKSPAILESCERLFTERGVEKIRNALEFYKEHKDNKYCPQITSPKKLEEKYADLSAYKTKIQ